MMAKFKANAYGLATSLSKALESVGSKTGTNHNYNEDFGGQKNMLNNNNPSNDPLSNYNYSSLHGHDAPACSSSSPTTSPPTKSRYSKSGTDYTPKCMRPKSLSFQEVETDPNEQVSSPVLTSSTNPFLPSGSTYSTRPFIYNDLKKSQLSPKSPNNNNYNNFEDGYMEELQEIKSNKKQKEYLETNFEGESVGDDKGNYKQNVGVPMVGMVPNAELVKINTQSPTSPQPLYPVAAIHPSQAVPLSSIFGLNVPITPQIEATQMMPATVALPPPPPQSLVDVNPNSKSTDIF